MNSNTAKQLCLSQLCTDEMSPAWLEGYRDGLAPQGGSSPDMRRGRDYAMGWLTGRWCRPRRDWLALLDQGLAQSTGC